MLQRVAVVAAGQPAGHRDRGGAGSQRRCAAATDAEQGHCAARRAGRSWKRCWRTAATSAANAAACAAAKIEPSSRPVANRIIRLAERWRPAPTAPENPTPVEAMTHRLAPFTARRRRAAQQYLNRCSASSSRVLGSRQFLLRGLDCVCAASGACHHGLEHQAAVRPLPRPMRRQRTLRRKTDRPDDQAYAPSATRGESSTHPSLHVVVSRQIIQPTNSVRQAARYGERRQDHDLGHRHAGGSHQRGRGCVRVRNWRRPYGEDCFGAAFSLFCSSACAAGFAWGLRLAASSPTVARTAAVLASYA